MRPIPRPKTTRRGAPPAGCPGGSARILTSHAGSLARPEDLIALNERRAAGDFTDEAEYLSRLRTAVAGVVARQREIGIDFVNDGEFGHSMGQRYDFGSWWTYVFQRLENVELTDLSIAEIPPSPTAS